MNIRRQMAVLLLASVSVIIGSTALAVEGFTMVDVIMERQDVPDNDALAFTYKLKAGWNLGNTFDAVDCDWLSNQQLYESAWCGTLTKPEVFNALKEAGFASVRIPVSWHNHVRGTDYTIDTQWLARVQEVVKYALDRGFYVILNTHHDIDPEYLYPDAEHLDSSIHYLTSIWEQLAEAFKDSDEHLIFEGMNEPRLKGTQMEWYLDPRNLKSKEAVQCINTLNQAFVNTVRASGGQNGTRYVMVTGYAASLDGAIHKDFTLPEDSVDNRIIVSVHAYVPYSFALQDQNQNGSQSTFDVSSHWDRVDIDNLMQKLYQKYIKSGIPVVLGEFGARDKGENLQARADYAAYFVATAFANGIPCFIWDNHAFAGSGELFGLLNRNTFTFTYPEIVESIMTYAR